MRTIQQIIGVCGVAALGAAFCIGQAVPASAAQVFSGGPCNPQTTLAVCFGAPPLPAQLRNIQYTAPSTGQATVTVHGSGYCVFQDTSVEQTADFETQITDSGATVASAKAAGGLRVKIRMPRSTAAGNPISVPFNLSSTRTFAVTKGQQKNFILAAHTIKFDSHVACYGIGIAMTILHTP